MLTTGYAADGQQTRSTQVASTQLALGLCGRCYLVTSSRVGAIGSSVSLNVVP
jgi:hypothetical protein